MEPAEWEGMIEQDHRSEHQPQEAETVAMRVEDVLEDWRRGTLSCAVRVFCAVLGPRQHEEYGCYSLGRTAVRSILPAARSDVLALRRVKTLAYVS